MTELGFKPRPSGPESPLYHGLNYEAHPWLHALWALGTDEGAWLTWGKKVAHCLPLDGSSSGQAVHWSNVVAMSQPDRLQGAKHLCADVSLLWAGNLALLQIWVQANNPLLTYNMDFCITAFLSYTLFLGYQSYNVLYWLILWSLHQCSYFQCGLFVTTNKFTNLQNPCLLL